MTRLAVFKILIGLAIGAELWLCLFGEYPQPFLSLGPWGWQATALLLLAVTALALLPISSKPIAQFFQWADRGLALHRAVASVGAAVASAGFLIFTAHQQHRPTVPYVHDEFSYLIQAQQMARGDLWMHGHPLPDFFDSFQLFTRDVYASAYFPGTALLYVPAVWLHLPAWVISITVAAAVAGLLFRIIAQTIGGVAAGLAVLLLWCDQSFRTLSMMTLAQLPLLLYGLLAVWAWMRWRDKLQHRWALLIGVFTGLAVITRPVDALCFVLPIGLAMLARLPWPAVGASRLPRRVVAMSLLISIAGAGPAIGLQLAANRGITGHWLTSPFRVYADEDYPGTAYGFSAVSPGARPVSHLPQKQELYREYLPLIQAHRRDNVIHQQLHSGGPMQPPRLPLTLSQDSPTPYPMLLVLMPAGLVTMDLAGLVLAVGPVIFITAYAGYVFFFSHYTVTAAPGLITLILLGAKQLEKLAWPTKRCFAVAMPLLLASLAIAALPQWEPHAQDNLFSAPLLDDVNRKLSQLPHQPAIVLFTYDPHRNTNEEPVYNPDVPWPDDAMTIRAHDLGDRDAELYRYYAARQPSRMVYRYDERHRTLQRLGVVADVAKQN